MQENKLFYNKKQQQWFIFNLYFWNNNDFQKFIKDNSFATEHFNSKFFPKQK